MPCLPRMYDKLGTTSDALEDLEEKVENLHSMGIIDGFRPEHLGIYGLHARCVGPCQFSMHIPCMLLISIYLHIQLQSIHNMCACIYIYTYISTYIFIEQCLESAPCIFAPCVLYMLPLKRHGSTKCLNTHIYIHIYTYVMVVYGPAKYSQTVAVCLPKV